MDYAKNKIPLVLLDLKEMRGCGATCNWERERENMQEIICDLHNLQKVGDRDAFYMIFTFKKRVWEGVGGIGNGIDVLY